MSEVRHSQTRAIHSDPVLREGERALLRRTFKRADALVAREGVGEREAFAQAWAEAHATDEGADR